MMPDVVLDEKGRNLGRRSCLQLDVVVRTIKYRGELRVHSPKA